MENGWSFEHLGTVVRDIDKAVEFWKSLDAVCHRPRGNYFMRIDALTVELHTAEDEHASISFRRVLKQYHDKYGEGVQHIHFSVDDLENERAKIDKMGFTVIHEGKRPEENFFEAHYDTYKVGGVSIAILNKPVPSSLVFSPAKSDWEFDHLGFVVRDIDEATALYQSLGMVLLEPIVEEVWDGKRLEVYGKAPTTPIKNKRSVLHKGSLITELRQPIGGDSIHRDFLEKHGDGVEHIHFSVANMEKEKAKMLQKGFPVISSVIITESSELVDAYFETRKYDGNIVIALTDTKNSFRDKFRPTLQRN